MKIVNMTTKTIALTTLMTLSLIGCASTDGEPDPNAAAKRGAAGGALVGLTMGALTGEADLAIKGAIAGGVSGGVAGSMADLDSSRENQRNEALAGAIASNNNTASPVTHIDQDNTLDRMVGDWRLDIWSLDAEGKEVVAEAQAKASLQKSTSAKLAVSDVSINGRQVPFSAESVFTLIPGKDYKIETTSSHSSLVHHFAGEKIRDRNAYQYYAVANPKQAGISGFSQAVLRVEMRFISDDLWLVDTYAQQGSSELKIQTYRFSRS